MRSILPVLAVLVAGCTEGQMAKYKAIGQPGHVTCYSGGVVIYEGDSSGVIGTETQSDGWYWEDAKTRKLIRVSGTCVVVN